MGSSREGRAGDTGSLEETLVTILQMRKVSLEGACPSLPLSPPPSIPSQSQGPCRPGWVRLLALPTWAQQPGGGAGGGRHPRAHPHSMSGPESDCPGPALATAPGSASVQPRPLLHAQSLLCPLCWGQAAWSGGRGRGETPDRWGQAAWSRGDPGPAVGRDRQAHPGTRRPRPHTPQRLSARPFSLGTESSGRERPVWGLRAQEGPRAPGRAAGLGGKPALSPLRPRSL